MSKFSNELGFLDFSICIDYFRTGDREDQLFYLSCLKTVLGLNWMVYKIKPTEELRDKMIELAEIIEFHEL